MYLNIDTVSEIKDFAHIRCMDPKAMYPAKYVCTFPFMILSNIYKIHAFPGAWV